MWDQVKNIKKRRTKLGIKQAQLARIANVSQSLIAKVESNRLDPSYSKAMQIIDALEQLEHQDEPKAKDIMMAQIISIEDTEIVEKAIELFKAHSVSQLPVMSNGSLVGLVSESIVLDHIINDPKCRVKKHTCKIKEIMNGLPPMVPAHTPISIVSQLLNHNSLVAVMNKADLAGIITKVDMFKAL